MSQEEGYIYIYMCIFAIVDSDSGLIGKLLNNKKGRIYDTKQ